MIEEEISEPVEVVTQERPEWLPEKFNSGEDLASSYKSLEQRLGTAPKTYNLAKADGWVKAEDEGFREMLELAKEKSVPQEVMDKMLETAGRYATEDKVDMDAEIASLGEGGGERLELLKNWAKSNLTEDSFFALTASINTAKGVRALEELRGKMMSDTTIIPTGHESASYAEDMSDIHAEMSNNLEKYKKDPKYRADVLNRIQRAQNDGYVDKTSA